jgi:ATP-dependent RNA helicase DeaD
MDFSPKTKAVETIEQFYFTVDQERKFELLVRLLKRDKPEQAIVFCRTKRGTEKILRRLTKHFPHADMMHGDMVQGARDRVMKAFRAGDVRILVATDVVGRGIDVSSISHIINYDIPQSSDDYVHRVGRTGRMGREGIAYTFVTTEEGGELTRIEILINRLLKRDEIEGFNAVATVAAAGVGVPSTTPSAATAETDPDKQQEPQPPRPTPPGRRPPKRHRRAL